MDVLCSIIVTAVLVSGFAGVALSVAGDALGLQKVANVGDVLVAIAVVLFITAVILPVAALAIIKAWSWL